MNPDIQLRHEVFAALNWDPAACCADVGVRVENGVVTLTGQLPDHALVHAVQRAARRVQGARAWVNELTVRPASEEARSDAGNSSTAGRP